MELSKDKKSSSEVLCREIEEQSKEEAKAVLDQAEKEKERILKEAQDEISRFQAENKKKAEMQAENIRKKVLSGVHLEIKRQRLRNREETISRILQAVKDKFENYRKTDMYLSFVKKLVIEGIQALDSDKIEIIPGKVEKQLLKNNVLKEIEKEAKSIGLKIHLAMSDEILSEGGVVLRSLNGRMRFDNRFSTRIKRVEETMRLKVMKTVFGAEL